MIPLLPTVAAPGRAAAGASALAGKLRRALRPYPPAGCYLVGVSGGRDSVALLHLLREAGYGRLTVCHLNHGLRPASAGDAEFVADLARDWDCPLALETADVAALARASKSSVETAGRRARRAFFASVGERQGCHELFLAHHADDQVETFLFRLLRGAGPAGLGAMRAESPLSPESPLRLLRPLLGVWREEIDAYVQTHRLPYREDASNAEAGPIRNRLRATVLPLLDRELGRSVRPALWRAADILAAENAWVETLLDSEPAPGAHLPAAGLRGQPVARQRRLVRRWLTTQDAPAVGFEEIDLILSLLDGERGPAKINLPGGWHARRRRSVIWLQSPPGRAADKEKSR